MEYKILQDMFVDFILEKVGPTKEKEDLIKSVFNSIKKIILTSLQEEIKYLNIEIIPFGSFPSKLYIKDSDLDLSIFFLNKDSNTPYDYDYEFLNKILQKIHKSLEINKDVSCLNLIFADVKIIKCKISDIPVDISINNYVGLCKLAFMNKLEKEIFVKEDKIKLFKRSLVLLKAWCSNESHILGSNISLMASYALECLVIYLFNYYSEIITSEFEAFELFFEVISKINWEKNILTIFGLISLEDFQKNTKIEENYENFIYEFYTKNKGFVHSDKIIEFMKSIDKYRDSDKTQSFSSNKKIINLKKLNIIDPLFSCNNLGKSINYYNYCKIIKVFENTNAQLIKMRMVFDEDDSSKIQNKSKYSTPINYLNALMKLFERSIANYYPELFYFSLIKPKIILDITSKAKQKSIILVDDVKTIVSTQLENSSVTELLVDDFNFKFKINKGINFFDIGLSESEKKKDENNYSNNIIHNKESLDNKDIDNILRIEANSFGSLNLTKEIIALFNDNFDFNNTIRVFKDYVIDDSVVLSLSSLLK